MATRLPSLPGGRRRFNVRVRTQTTAQVKNTTSDNAFSKSPTLNNPKARQKATQASKEPTPGAVISPGDEAAAEEVAGSAAHFAEDDIKPDFLGEGSKETEDSPANEDPASDDVAKKEAETDTTDGNETATNAQEAGLTASEPENDENSDWENNTGSNGRRGRLSAAGRFMQNRRRAIIASIGLSIAGTIGAAILFIPTLMTNYISNLITNGIGKPETHHQERLRTRKMTRFSDNFTPDGRRGGKIIDEMDRRGYRFVPDPTDSRKIAGILTPGSNTPITDPRAIAATFEDYLDKNHGIRARNASWKTSRMDALHRRWGVDQRPINQARPGDVEDPDQEAAKRSYEAANEGTRAEADAVESPNQSDPEGTDEEVEAEEERRQEKLDDVKKNIKETSPELEEIQSKAARGEVLTAAERDALAAIEDGLPPSSLGAAAGSSIGRSVASRAASLAVSLVSMTEVPRQLCNVKSRLALAEGTARALSSITLMRAALSFVTADDGVRSGQAASGLTGALLSRVTTSDPALGNFASSPGFQMASTGTFSKNTNDETRTPFAIDGKLTGLLGGLKNAVESIGIPGWACATLENAFASVAIDAGALVVTVVASVFTGGGAAAAKETAVQSLKLALQQTIKSIFTKRGLATIGAQVGAEYGIEMALASATAYAQKKLLMTVTGQETGARLSSQLFAGAGVTHRFKNLRAGQVPATTAQYAASHERYLAESKEDKKNESVFARIFDLDNYDSLASRTTGSIALNGNISDINSLVPSIMSAPITALASIAQPFTGTSSAAEDLVAYDEIKIEGTSMAADPYGNILTVIPEDIASRDWNTVIDRMITGGYIDENLEPTESENGKKLSEHLERCVDASDQIGALEDDMKNDNKWDCLAGREETKDFKAYLNAIDSYDFYNSAIDPESVSQGGENEAGVGSAQPTTGSGSSTSVTGLNITGPVIPCEGQPRTIVRGTNDSTDWSGIVPTGSIGTNVKGEPINVYVRAACAQQDVQTVVIAGSIHGSENGGQLVAQEMLFNADQDDNVQVIAIPKICACAGTGDRSANKIDGRWLDLNRDYDFRWGDVAASQRIPKNDPNGRVYYKGPNPESQPEIQAMVSFLEGLGRVDLFVVYHDALNYTAPVGSTPLNIAEAFVSATGSGLGNDRGTYVNQAGSLDGWFNQQTDSPTILVEWYNNPNDAAVKKQVDAIKAAMGVQQ